MRTDEVWTFTSKPEPDRPMEPVRASLLGSGVEVHLSQPSEFSADKVSLVPATRSVESGIVAERSAPDRPAA
jgi:hypothetical protein